MPLVITLFASASLVGFVAALGTGMFGAWLIPALPNHQTLGTVAALLACSMHCAVFTYFLGTGMSIKDAVETYDLDPALAEETRTLKKRSFPWVFNAILLLLGAVVLGGFAMTRGLPPIVHGLGAGFAVVFSLFAFYKELQAIRDNVKLLETLKKNLTAKAASAEWPMPSEADISRVDQGRALVFLGFTVAFAFVYLKYITRTPETPLTPFALASVLAVSLGSMILRTEGRSR